MLLHHRRLLGEAAPWHEWQQQFRTTKCCEQGQRGSCNAGVTNICVAILMTQFSSCVHRTLCAFKKLSILFGSSRTTTSSLAQDCNLYLYIAQAYALKPQRWWAVRAGRAVSTLEQAAKASLSSSASCCMENWKLYHRTCTPPQPAMSGSLSAQKGLGSPGGGRGKRAGDQLG